MVRLFAIAVLALAALVSAVDKVSLLLSHCVVGESGGASWPAVKELQNRPTRLLVALPLSFCLLCAIQPCFVSPCRMRRLRPALPPLM